MNTFSLDKPFLETLRNRLLIALYEKSPRGIEVQCARILSHWRSTLWTEANEKYLRQIETALNHLLPGIKVTQTIQNFQDEIHTLLVDLARTQTPLKIPYPSWEKRQNLLPWQWNAIFKNAITLQLTSGCSNYCRRCNEWALPQIRAHFDQAAVKTFLNKLDMEGNTTPALYGASDPLDWEDQGQSLADLLVARDQKVDFSILTKVPRNREGVLETMVSKEIPFSVSLTRKNKKRVQALQKELNTDLGIQHDTEDLLIPAGLDEDFTSIKSSITDGYGTEISTDGVFMILPTFTSALHPMGHQKIRLTGSQGFIPVQKLGRRALLVDYFKPLEVQGPDSKKDFLTHLLPVQVETILLDSGTMDLTPPGMRNLKEFFTIFDQASRKQRHKNTPVVLKKLKDKYQDILDEEGQKIHQQKVLAHMDFCDPYLTRQFRLNAAAFFLESCQDYLTAHTDEIKIITQLTQAEYESLKKNNGLHLNLAKADEDRFFELFRFYLLEMIRRGPDARQKEFIGKYKGQFDPIADRFIGKT